MRSQGGGHVDREGRFHAWGQLSVTIVAAYIVLFLVVLAVFRYEAGSAAWWTPWLLTVLILGSLARYLTTHYRIDDSRLHASRLLGGQTILLEEVRRIEYARIRDLSPTGFFGSWGWRGRMWSPIVGRFDAIYTDPVRGLLITAGEHPIYVSPRDVEGFARELSRRVRSYTGRLAADVGDPLGSLNVIEGA